ncbi:unnamed protein product [Bursaphelenchus okinawaensis]|uniref:peptidylprolyl isomerase n=1 Tax=Bursaphelenchus okinawaensis TaxID=465554 RepID=A0A811LN83_9BILA|nr:unnamed protein product [Bursaphelenchus okinawaensis]CAG9125232.1 unnamed protein product [Bursaphelenchus okinawaensis]
MSKDRRRCFLDITVDGELMGRIVIELYDDICPETCENFCQLCVGESGIGKTTGKMLHFKGSIFHRVVKNFMIQGGDFTNGNGTGGESIYGGVFEDENFVVKHDEPFIVSMANRGPNTNGSQFFVTTSVTSHLDDVHVAFGRVVQGQEVVTQIENLKTGPKNRPVSDVVIANCGQLIRKKKENEEGGLEPETDKKKKDKKKKHGSRSRSPYKEASPELPDDISTVKVEDLPEVPVTHNFLLRNSSPKNGNSSLYKGRRDYDRNDRYGRRGRDRSPPVRRDRQGLKVRGRGRLCYRSLSREGSRTPPHWKKEESRIITYDELKKKKEEREKRLQEEEESEEHKFGYRASPSYDSPNLRQEHSESRQKAAETADETHKAEKPRKRPEIVYDRGSPPRRADRNEEKGRDERQEKQKEDREDKDEKRDKSKEGRNERRRCDSENSPDVRKRDDKIEKHDKRRSRERSPDVKKRDDKIEKHEKRRSRDMSSEVRKTDGKGEKRRSRELSPEVRERDERGDRRKSRERSLEVRRRDDRSKKLEKRRSREQSPEVRKTGENRRSPERSPEKKKDKVDNGHDKQESKRKDLEEGHDIAGEQRKESREERDGSRDKEDRSGDEHTPPRRKFIPLPSTANVDDIPKRKIVEPPPIVVSTCVVETAPVVTPETDQSKDHGKGEKREHRAIEKDRIEPHKNDTKDDGDTPTGEKFALSREKPSSPREQGSPPRKYSRRDSSSSKSSNKDRNEKPSRSRKDSERKPEPPRRSRKLCHQNDERETVHLQDDVTEDARLHQEGVQNDDLGHLEDLQEDRLSGDLHLNATTEAEIVRIEEDPPVQARLVLQGRALHPVPAAVQVPQARDKLATFKLFINVVPRIRMLEELFNCGNRQIEPTRASRFPKIYVGVNFESPRWSSS